MNIETFRCPNCGGEIKFLDNRDFVFCSYCGSQIYKDDGSKRIRYDINKCVINENIDYTKMRVSDNELKDKKYNTIMLIGYLVFSIIALIFMNLFVFQ